MAKVEISFAIGVLRGIKMEYHAHIHENSETAIDNAITRLEAILTPSTVAALKACPRCGTVTDMPFHTCSGEAPDNTIPVTAAGRGNQDLIAIKCPYCSEVIGEKQVPIPITPSTVITGPCILMKPGRSLYWEHDVTNIESAIKNGWTHYLPFKLPMLPDEHAEDRDEFNKRATTGI